MLIKNMDYLAQRLHCTDAEKDACLETVVEILHLWDIIRRDGLLAVGCVRADQEADPFFRTCLRDLSDIIGSENEPLMEELFTTYLVAGDYRGADLLRNVVIAEGLLLIPKVFQDETMPRFRKWGEKLSLTVRGYFGADYRDKVEKVILREVQKHEKEMQKTSYVQEFDSLAELPQELCVRLWQEVPGYSMRIALKYAGTAARDRITSVLSPEEQEQLEDDLELYHLLREVDVVNAQREIIEKAASYQV